MDLNPLIDKAMARTNVRNDSEYSKRLGHARNYVAKLRDGAGISASMLAKLYEDAGEDPTKPVLLFLRDREEGTARKIIDKALKAVSAACVVAVFGFAFGALTPHPASASTNNVEQSSRIHYATILWALAELGPTVSDRFSHLGSCYGSTADGGPIDQ